LAFFVFFFVLFGSFTPFFTVEKKNKNPFVYFLVFAEGRKTTKLVRQLCSFSGGPSKPRGLLR